jgi:NDP-sugar pyrophosphorylase family protein
MQAVVLAGGRGTRLRPYTATFPKPLVPLGDMPVIELLLRQLSSAGISDVIIAVNHLHHLIRAFCGDGSAFGVKIEYVLEHEPLGTAGPISAALPQLGENFVVANGDLLTNFDIGAMAAEHTSTQSAASVAVFKRELKIDFGIVETTAGMQMTGYIEKPTYSHLVSMGLYVLRKSALAERLIPGQRLDMPDLMQALIASDERVQCYCQDCVWLDIGRPDDYAEAQNLFDTNRSLFLRA